TAPPIIRPTTKTTITIFFATIMSSVFQTILIPIIKYYGFVKILLCENNMLPGVVRDEFADVLYYIPPLNIRYQINMKQCQREIHADRSYL
ncbi:MAG: hypothetical protein ACLPN1_15265, partial [Dissulfurispiraceae bacterium]